MDSTSTVRRSLAASHSQWVFRNVTQLAQCDVNDAVAHYEENANNAVADGFFEELLTAIDEVARSPKSFPFRAGSSALRHVNLKRFPFHSLYEIRSGSICVVVVRHHDRHPRFGRRQDEN